MLVDTHCHVHDPEMFAGIAKARHLPPPLTPEGYLSEAVEVGVTEVICIGTSVKDSANAAEFASAHENVYATVGIHPENLNDPQPTSDLLKLAKSPRAVAIGEIGLDYHYPELEKTAQIRLFEEQLQLATEVDLPVVLHIREAFADAFAVIGHFPGLRGVLHSFSDNLAAMEQGLSKGFYIGINGIATFTKDPEQQRAFAALPLERMLLETDAPFLTPKPFRGKINQPAYTRAVGEWVAATRGVDLEIVAKTTTQNAHDLFNFGG